ncbi:Mur ligase family protein [Actinomyces sp. oral taxon 448]|uniref:Mur ligase family protein n=1 Tax=Actinomyces sp. oral taxon 448 TaxID=712124 RepID=UPI0002188E43|nr:Mur ligase family protein [Actinomyces sp. oral taxon 448]EGQ76026.1 UDP-N-acetylmuramoylalanyl-D-glutamate--2,6-diaminopimelate ligase [Actinomyces sp. oral taxon 448 str. F0400]
MDLSPAASLRSRITVALGRTARLVSRLRGGGSGGTALPGLVVEKTDPGFLARTLGQLPMGVIVVSGTNGKTTTTKMVVQLLREQGLTVLTNRSGSNFVRGVLASLLTEVDAGGRVHHDVAVLELDEAHAVRFVRLVKPRHALLLNVMRDQLDRFGEIDYTASLLHKVALATTGSVVVNADDPRLGAASFIGDLRARVAAFGAGEALRALFVSDDDLRTGARAQEPRASGAAKEAGEEGAPVPQAPAALAPRVSLESLRGRDAVVRVDGTDHDVTFTIPGIHNQLNACAALAVALEALGDRADLPGLLTTLARVQAAFGRGEVLALDGRDVQLSLVKNPAGFRMGLLTAAEAVRSGGPESVMIAINDEYADGRDMSWLWDVEFAGLRAEGVAVVTGVRAWDMALRLRYDEVPVGTVEPDLTRAVALLREAAGKADDGAGRPMRIFTTYTAMLALRAHLAELTDVEEALT